MSEGSFLFYDDSGVIHKVLEIDAEGLNVIPGYANDATQMVDVAAAAQVNFQAMLVDKPALNPVIAVSGLQVTVSGAPENAMVILGNARALITQGEASVIAGEAGEHQILVRHPQYLPYSETVVAEAP